MCSSSVVTHFKCINFSSTPLLFHNIYLFIIDYSLDSNFSVLLAKYRRSSSLYLLFSRRETTYAHFFNCSKCAQSLQWGAVWWFWVGILQKMKTKDKGYSIYKVWNMRQINSRQVNTMLDVIACYRCIRIWNLTQNILFHM